MSITKEEIIPFDFDRKGLAERILNSKEDLDTVVEWMATDKKIMVYYNCFYLLQDVSRREPEKCIRYWNTFVKLLEHPNSYHRDIAFTLISNCICADTEHLFDAISETYYAGINDPKFKTGVLCIAALGTIAEARTDLVSAVFGRLLQQREHSRYTERQNEYIAGVIASVFDKIMDSLQSQDKRNAEAYICANRNSKSPKARAVCKDIIIRRKLAVPSM